MSKPAMTVLLTILPAGCRMTEPSATSSGKPLGTPRELVQWTFDKDPINVLPKEWYRSETSPSAALAEWAVVADATAPSPPNALALAITNNERATFNLAILKHPMFEDLDLTVKVKANTGRIDQGGGPIWRCRDENNYYVCRLNPLEGNYRVYRVIDGRRTQLGTVDVPLKTGQWHAVRVTMQGPQIACFLDGRKLLEATDDSLSGEGMAGLWTKADAATAFDDLTVARLEGP